MQRAGGLIALAAMTLLGGCGIPACGRNGSWVAGGRRSDSKTA